MIKSDQRISPQASYYQQRLNDYATAFERSLLIVIRIDHCSPIPLVIISPTVALHESAMSKVARGSKGFWPRRIDGAGPVIASGMVFANSGCGAIG